LLEAQKPEHNVNLVIEIESITWKMNFPEFNKH